MSTVGEIIEQVRLLLYTGRQSRLNTLTTAITTATTTLTMEHPVEYQQNVATGDYLGIEDEVLYVWRADPASRTVWVQRGMFGSAVASHDTGILVEIAPRFTRWVIRSEVERELRSWPRSLYAVNAVTLTVGTVTKSVDLNLGVLQPRYIRVLRVLAKPESNTDWFPIDFRVEQNMPTAEFPSGTVLTVQPKLGANPQGGPVRVIVALDFDLTTLTDSVDLVGTVGLVESMEDIAVYGAAARLLSGTEINRTDAYAQGESRVASEVPATHRMQTANQLKVWRDARIAEESSKLWDDYGIRM